MDGVFVKNGELPLKDASTIVLAPKKRESVTLNFEMANKRRGTSSLKRTKTEAGPTLDEEEGASVSKAVKE